MSSLSEEFATGRFGISPEKFPHLRSSDGSRVRRYADAFKDAVINESVKRGRAKNGSSMLRSYDMDDSLARKWEKQYMAWFMQASFRAFRGTKHLSVSEDSLRCGDPPEETNVLILWSAQADKATVAPVQVTRGNVPTKPKDQILPPPSLFLVSSFLLPAL